MTSANFGEPESVSLRKVWPDETLNFTPWLTENLHLLGEVVGIELSPVQREAYRWSGFLDILAEAADRSKVVIENQLERSDNDHFVRLIGYAADHDARVLVWVAPEFREHHQRMLGWLKDAMSGNKEIYAVEVRIERGGDLRPADGDVADLGYHPVFTAIELHSDWPERASAETTAYAHFYGPVVEQLRKAGMPPMGKRGWRKQWRSFPTGYEHIVYALRLSNGEASAFLDVSGDAALPVYRSLREYQPQIDAEMGNSELEWHEDESESWIAIRTAASLEDTEEELEATRKWMFNNLLKLRDTIQPYLNEVMSKLQTNVTPAPNATELDQ